MRNYFDSDFSTYPVWGRHDHSERFVQPEEVEKKEMNDLIELHFFLRKVRGKLAGHLDVGGDK